jgi:hypothetical protein
MQFSVDAALSLVRAMVWCGLGEARASPAPETSRIHFVLCGTQNRTFDPYSASIDRILISVMSGPCSAAVNGNWHSSDGAARIMHSFGAFPGLASDFIGAS